MSEEAIIWKLLEAVPDPEIPVLSVIDLGVIRKIDLQNDQTLITITPTYSGCPAMNQFEDDITTHLTKHGYQNIIIKTSYNPAWTTDWLSEEAKHKLEKYGIAPPQEKTTDKSFLLGEQPTVRCPQCKSTHTKLVSQFGSTACKALYQCNDCKEPFDYFKCL
ncbi:MAG: phenylacetate-CoA oxygenase subunit PaaJ [Flavobacteriales bacterium]|nr:phenylacetate-CoA oxygenase subunit PaaJ [Flavobacteriales bacterium]